MSEPEIPEQTQEETLAVLTALLDASSQGRRALKRAAAELDGLGEVWKAALVALVAGRGVTLPAEASGWPGKKLLRRARGREDAARVRRNPIRRDDAFGCEHCGAEVTPGGARVRDHCPSCLRSLHVDEVPGDRAAECGGVLAPVGLELVSGASVIRYRCVRCGAARRCRAHPDDDVRALAALSGLSGLSGLTDG